LIVLTFARPFMQSDYTSFNPFGLACLSLPQLLS
jgi:hypothetical protein